MYRIGILLLGMASLATSGILTNRNRFGIHPLQGMGLNGMQQDLDSQNVFSRDELLRQKFIMDILQQINLPLQNQELMQLGNGDVTNENLYKQRLDEDTLFVLGLIRKNQMLDNDVAWSVSNDLHLRQMVGLYKLLLNARDFQTFQRLVIYARRNLNTEMFVNSLVLALGERSDTNMLIIPALYEILPQLYHHPDLIEDIRHIGEQNLLSNSDGVSSIRPNLLDVITFGRQNRLLNTHLPESWGIWNILNRSELWMPWRRLHQQLALRKALGGRTLDQVNRNVEKLGISIPVKGIQEQPLGLLTDDLDMKSYLNILIDELIVQQGSNRKIGRDILGENRNLNSRDEYATENMDRNLFSQRNEGINTNRRTGIDNINSVSRIASNQDDILTAQGRHGLMNKSQFYVDTEGSQEATREIYETQTRDENMGEPNNDNIPYVGRRRRNRFPNRVAERRITTNQDEHSTQTNDQDILDESKDDTVNLNDNRMLFVGRRRENLSGIRNELDIGNMFEDDTTSSGRHVSRDEQRVRNIRRNDQERYSNNDNMDRGVYYQSRYGNGVSGVNQDIESNIRDNGRSTWIGRGRNAFLDTSYRVNQDEQQLNEGDVETNQGSTRWSNRLGTDVPTTAVNDEPLLPINRRRLNEMQESTRVGNFGDDEYQQSNYLSSRSRLNNENVGNTRRYPNIEEEGVGNYVDRDDDNISRGNLLTRRRNDNEDGVRRYVKRDGDNNSRRNLYSRRRLDEEEGDRKYVDRDEEEGNTKYVGTDADRSRGGNLLNRRGNNEDGNRMFVGRDDDRSRGGNLINRRRQNEEEGDSIYVNRDYGRQSGDLPILSRDNMNGQSDQHIIRYRRSLGNERSINGRLLMHTLQQLAARINIERISLRKPQQLDDNITQGNDRRLINDIPSGSNLNQQDLLVMKAINDIYERLEVTLQENIPRLSALTNGEQINEIGLLLAGQIGDLGLLDILSEILPLDNDNQEGQLTNILQHPLYQSILCRIVNILDSNIKKLQHARDLSLQGVTINNIKVDKLQTFVEYSDVELTNLLNINIDYSDTANKKLIVGGIPRLNHKSFNIKLDIDSDRQQQVVVRTFLGPKTDANDNILSLTEQRQNYILLDISTIELEEGRNKMSLNSNDITWTSRDITPSSEIYERVMRALGGDVMLSKNVLIGQSNLFPHRLLIPRGRVNGLAMQLLTVITAIDQGTVLDRNSNGLDSLLVDRLPLNYPLDGDIQDLNSFLAVPNMFLKDVTIYHDDNINPSRLW